MDACNLCLQNTYQLVDSEVSRRLSACIKFSNYLPNIPHQKHMFACELCLQNFSTFIEFHDMVVATESKIEFVLKELSCQKVNLKSICDGANMLDKRQHCRVCLNPVKWLGIYLYKNDTNILDFSILKKMFTYCNLNLDFEVSDRPVLCRQCFERLQITYNFKKTITEAFEGGIESIEDDLEEPTVSDPEVRVRNDLMYQLEEHNYSSRQISAESDPKLKCNAVVVLERLPDIVPNPVYQRRRRRRKGQKSQSRSYLNRNCKLKSNHETENNSTQEESRLTLSANSQTSNHRGELENDQLGHGRVYNNEDLILLQLYYTHTKLETDFPTGYWENIAFDWRSITRKIKGQLQLSRKVYRLLSKSLIPQNVIDRIKNDVKKKLEMQLNQQSATEESDRLNNQASDNSDNTGECSTIVIKQEPPCDMDIEIWFPEPTVEPPSDSETESADSPPQLDRMDIATSSSYVLSVQKRALGACGTDHTYSVLQKHTKKPVVSHPKILLEEDFRCSECFFTTKVEWWATRHMILHQSGNLKIHQCPKCTYRITSKKLLSIHKRTHYNDTDDDAPMLTPWYTEGKLTREEKQEMLSMSKLT